VASRDGCCGRSCFAYCSFFFDSAPVLFVLAAIVCVFRIASFWSLEVALSASLAAALMISPHSYIQDVMLLMPLALHAIARKAQTDWVAAWILSPVAAYALALWPPLIGPAMIVAPVCVLLAQFAVEETHKVKSRFGRTGLMMKGGDSSPAGINSESARPYP